MNALPQRVVDAVSDERIRRLLDALSCLAALAAAAPNETVSVVLAPFFAPTREALSQKLREASLGSGTDWVGVEGTARDGRRMAYATDLVGGTSQLERIVHLQLFDLHPRMVAWYLTALWRAHELADDLVASLSQWHVVSTAALSRSLFEGSFAFIGESTEMTAVWSEMKSTGPPDFLKANLFRDHLDELLLQAQYGTKIGEPVLRRHRVKKLIERGVEQTTQELAPLMKQYNWLCDAVHPSWGFQTAYTTRLLLNESRTQMMVEAGRGVDAAPDLDGTQPDVAIAAVDAASTALEELTTFLPHFLLTVDDYGLTTGVCFNSRLEYWRRHNKPSRNDPCPCGGGRKFKSCIHAWGLPVAVGPAPDAPRSRMRQDGGGDQA